MADTSKRPDWVQWRGTSGVDLMGVCAHSHVESIAPFFSSYTLASPHFALFIIILIILVCERYYLANSRETESECTSKTVRDHADVYQVPASDTWPLY